jgi:hypothetical protein
MELRRISRYLRFCGIACLAVFGLAAAEHHGLVKFGTVPVPGATVTATQGDKKMIAVTDDTGVYSFPELADGVWKIQVDMLCFAPVAKEIGIAPNAPGAEWELKLLSMEEIKPSMQAAPPPSAAAPASAAPGAAGTPAPGAATPPPAKTAASTPAKAPAKGGKKGAAPATPQAGFQRTDVNASTDGAAAPAASASAPSIAAADPAQNTADAFVVNGSGSNGIERRAIGNARKGPGSLFNGGLSFQFDNSVLNARNYSLTGQDTPRTPYNHFQVGAQFGGPLLVPHVFRWAGNFFLGYQITRNRTANNATAQMPTAAERAGDFSQVTNAAGSPVTILDPNNGQPFPTGNVLPPDRISPAAKYLLNFYPLPQFTLANQTYNYQIPIIGRNNSDAVQARVNKTINNKSGLQTQFTYVNARNENNNVFSFLDNTDVTNYRANATYRRTFSRQVFGTFGVDYTRSSIHTTPFFAFQKNVSGAAGITGNDQSPGDWGPPSLSFQSGIQGLSDGNESFNRNQTTAFSVNLNYIRRPHNFQFGGDWRIQDFSQLGQQNGRGKFGFNGLASGFDFAGFLLGVPDTRSLAFGNADKYLKAGMYDAFVNDDWRVSPALTLNWGIRWEYGSPIVEKYNRLVNLDIAPGFASSSPVLASSPMGALSKMQYPNSLIKPDKHAVQPRISFAWKPIFGASTVVRGAYGVYYNTSAYVQMANQMTQQSPLSKSLTVQNGPANRLTLENGFIASPIATPNTFAIDPDYLVGYSQNWSLSVQQNVSASMVMTAAYLGIKGTRQPQAFLPNTYAPGVINPCDTCLPGYTYLTSNGNSTKHSGQLSLRRRFHSGVSTNFTYTYSKAIDDAIPGGANWSTAQDWRNLAAERGLSSFDQRHLFTAQLQYSTGVGVHGGALLSGWRGTILKGWTFVSNISGGTGLPLNPVYSVPISGLSGPLRPQYTGADVYAGQGNRFLNPAAFSAPPTGQFGNAGRNSITGPNQFTMNGSMQRSFADNIDLRIDSTNVLNHPNFTSWNTTFNPNLANGGPLFGAANPPGAMRSVQATLRWRF